MLIDLLGLLYEFSPRSCGLMVSIINDYFIREASYHLSLAGYQEVFWPSSRTTYLRHCAVQA